MKRACAVIALLTFTAAEAGGQDGLTEAMALQLGLTRDAVQQRVEGKLLQGQSDVIAARTLPNPELGYQREVLNDDENRVEQTLTLSQRFDFSGRRALQRQAADLHLGAARLEADAWRADLAREIRERYYDALLYQARREAYTDTRQRIDRLGKALRKRRREGDVSLYDYQRVNAERTRIEAEADNAETDFQTKWRSLWALLGADSAGYRELTGELAPGPATPLETLTARLERQPALLELKTKSDAFALQRRAESRTFPDITLGLGVKRDETDERSDNGLVLQATIPIPLADVREDKRLRYRAQALVADSDYRLAYERALSELDGLWNQDTGYRRNAERFRRDAVRGARDLIGTAESYYRADEVGILELLDAYRGALDAELTALDLEHKARLARIQLEHLTGGPDQ